MKRWFASISFLALLGVVPLIGGEPVRAQISQVKDAVVESLLQPEVKLTLGAEKKVIKLDENGQENTVWEELKGRVTVQPGDVIRYTVDGSNSSDVEAANLQIIQPVPTNTIFELGSAKGNAHITYSIDNGQTFVVAPVVEIILPDGTVELKPAPADAYTHVKWSFDETLTSAEAVKVSYNVVVR